jgi:YVTN family beta-propeller protein
MRWTWYLLRLGACVLGFFVIGLGAPTYAAPFAYIANSNSTTVSVIDTATDLVIATIPVGVQPQDVAVHPDGSRVYTYCISRRNFFGGKQLWAL